MSPHDDLEARLRRHLERTAAPLRAPDLDVDAVRRRGRRRRNAVRSATATGSIVALVAAGLVVMRIAGGEGDERFAVDGGSTVATVADVAPGTTAPTVSIVADGDTPVPPSAFPVAGPARTMSSADMGSRVARWGDGYVRIVTEWSQEIAQPVPDDVAALLPAEVLDVLASDGAAGLDALSERPDLMSEVERIVAEHEIVYEALFGSPGTATVRFETSADGTEWTPAGETSLPDGVDYIADVAAADDRLLVVGSSYGNEQNGLVSSSVVASTTDLRGWDTVASIDPVDPMVLTDGFRRSVHVPAVAVGPDGTLAVVVSESSDFDIDTVLPDELRDELHASPGGYSAAAGESGVTIEVFDATREITAPGPDGTEIIGYEEGQVTATYSFTWDELGVDADAALSPPRRTALWTGDVVEGLTPIDVTEVVAEPSSLGGVAVTGDGVVLAVNTADGVAVWFARPGEAWVERSTAIEGDGYVERVARTSGGVLMLVDHPAGRQLWVSDGRAENWRRGADLPAVDVGDAGPTSSVTLADGDAAGFAAVLSVEPGAGVDDSAELVLEREGYRLTRPLGGWSSINTPPPVSELVRVADDGTEETVFVWDDTTDPDEHVVTGADGSVTLLDPTSGEPLVTFTPDDVDDAYAAATGIDPRERSSAPWRPTFVVVHTVDGTSWSVLDVVEPEPAAADDGGDDLAAAGEPIVRWPSALVLTATEVLVGIGGPDDTVEYRIYVR